MAASKFTPSLICLIGIISPAFGSEIESALDDAPRVTLTATGIHGDPIDVGLIGTKDELIAAMIAAKWQPADSNWSSSSQHLWGSRSSRWQRLK